MVDYETDFVRNFQKLREGRSATRRQRKGTVPPPPAPVAHNSCLLAPTLAPQPRADTRDWAVCLNSMHAASHSAIAFAHECLQPLSREVASAATVLGRWNPLVALNLPSVSPRSSTLCATQTGLVIDQARTLGSESAVTANKMEGQGKDELGEPRSVVAPWFDVCTPSIQRFYAIHTPTLCVYENPIDLYGGNQIAILRTSSKPQQLVAMAMAFPSVWYHTSSFVYLCFCSNTLTFRTNGCPGKLSPKLLV